ncbi:DUF342 domain-containing protein [Alkalicoccus chagannorensis]|uniref:DUF342 domain-containing protein n=1 Tax=Alkalicoccus chagannorensis TaxID=427072 RepID=UPI0003F93D1F|nr:FapA family protein [Alkalicoccus chagannorensis]
MDLHDYYDVHIREDRLAAELRQLAKVDDDQRPQVEELRAFLSSCGVTEGIRTEALEQAAAQDLSEPITAAEGTPAEKGKDAELWTILQESAPVEGRKEQNDTIDLREVIRIPTVEPGDIVGRKIPAEAGKPGIRVDGSTIEPKDGKDLTLRPGKNTVLDESGMAIKADKPGQVSQDAKTVHVYNVFEVQGDLDLKTGNIEFNGNVVIRGMVPEGFKVKTRGDIRVEGTVEGAFLEAEGSIYIRQGIVAQGQGSVTAQGDLHAGFLNQAVVTVGGSVHVEKTILHSQVSCSGMVECRSIVGGHVSGGMGITVQEVGNKMHSPTSLYVGVSRQTKEAEKAYESQMEESGDTEKKLLVLKQALEKKRQVKPLSEKEQQSLDKVETSLKEVELMRQKAAEHLEKITEVKQNFDEKFVTIHKTCFPNTDIHFGKYRRKVTMQTERVKFFIENGEISFSQL